ncbi:hypothetical protein V6N12_001020 [Hibiscus sabdariffa]|uniref:Uncharacterized protein n=1 Tax=Hibiscus sabdariffa TaxID=183260 RepID=A0ABR2AS13_9ROSI
MLKSRLEEQESGNPTTVQVSVPNQNGKIELTSKLASVVRNVAGLSSELLVVPEAEKWRQGSLFVQPHGVSNEDNDQVTHSVGVRVLSSESEERANVLEAESSEQLLPETGSLVEEANIIESAHSSRDASESACSAIDTDVSESAHPKREADASESALQEREGDEVESARSVEVTVPVIRNQHCVMTRSKMLIHQTTSSSVLSITSSLKSTILRGKSMCSLSRSR